MNDDPPGHRRFLTTTALAGAVVLAAALATPWSWTAPTWIGNAAAPEPAPPPSAPTTTAQPRPDIPDVSLDTGGISLGDVLLILGALVALLLLVLLARALRLRHAGTTVDDHLDATPGATHAHTDVEPDLPRLRDAVAAAHDQFDDALPPQDAVIAAWVHLEDAAALAGAGRDHAQTPTEFTSAVLARTTADPAAVAVLRGLYHRARFRADGVRAPDVEAARAALARIAADLEASAGSVPRTEDA